MDYADIQQTMLDAQTRWGLPLKRKTANEAAGPCPSCGGEDRFLIFLDGGYYCRQCERTGWLDDNKPQRKQSKEEILERRIATLERRQVEHDKRLSRLEQMHGLAHLVDEYHANLDGNWPAVERWHEHYGVGYDVIAERKLGCCPSVPLAPRSASLTIPVTYHGKLYNVRHRLLTPGDRGKYLPHLSGLPSVIFNADDLDSKADTILILEGEIKSIVVSERTGLANVATMGMQGFKQSWVKRLDKFTKIIVCLDPDAAIQAEKIAGWFGKRARVARLPVKSDDFFVLHGGTKDEFAAYLANAKPARRSI